MMDHFHVSATGHSLNYLPEYIATRHGFFAEQNLNVTVTVPKPWDRVLDELEDRTPTANAALGGVWVPSMYRNRSKHYTTFAQISNRSPLALVKRGASAEWELNKHNMVGRTVLLKSGNGASVGIYFKMLLREHGIDAESVKYIQDLEGPMLSKLFEGGLGDFFVIDVISARALARRDPSFSVAMEFCTDGGEIPWSVYYTKTASMTAKVIDAQRRFCVALQKGIDWVIQHDAESFRDELAQIFSALPVDIVVDMVNVYRKCGMWTTTCVSRYGFERWQKGICDGSLIEQPLYYDDMVQNGVESEEQAPDIDAMGQRSAMQPQRKSRGAGRWESELKSSAMHHEHGKTVVVA